MENNTNIKIPKKYQDKLSFIDYYDLDGYTAWAKNGYYFTYHDMNICFACEDTQKELLEVIRTVEKEPDDSFPKEKDYT